MGFCGFVGRHTLEIEHDDEVDDLARSISQMPDKQAAMLILTRITTHKEAYLKRGIDARLSRGHVNRGIVDAGIYLRITRRYGIEAVFR